jgi:hypothetical protein
MIQLFSIEFWFVVQLIIDLFIVLLFLIFIKRVGKLRFDGQYQENQKGRQGKIKQEIAEKAADDIIEMLEPFVKESKLTADSFDRQIKEKRKLIGELNESLDSRIISINLLISRAEAIKEDLRNLKLQAVSQPVLQMPSQHESNLSDNVLDQQNSIIDMYNNGLDVDTIVSKLSMPKGEVKLVIDLKKKFKAMEQNE